MALVARALRRGLEVNGSIRPMHASRHAVHTLATSLLLSILHRCHVDAPKKNHTHMRRVVKTAFECNGLQGIVRLTQ
jgi:hypothetical protein